MAEKMKFSSARPPALLLKENFSLKIFCLPKGTPHSQKGPYGGGGEGEKSPEREKISLERENFPYANRINAYI